MAGAMSSKKERHKNRLPPFVPLLVSTLDSPAWRAMSHGAKSLYVALKRRVPNGRNRAFLAYRQAEAELRSSRRKIGQWFSELEHYGFIVLEKHGSLGLDGKGKSPHWRLTELGNTPKASADGNPESPTRNFLQWKGVRFEPPRDARTPGSYGCKKQNPGSDGGNGAFPTGETPSFPTGETLKSKTVSDGVAIEHSRTVSDGVAITSLPLPGRLSLSHGKPWTKPKVDDLEPRRFQPRRRNGRWA